MKREYGPTLGQLLAPGWHASSRAFRVLVVMAGVGAVALLVAAALSLLNSTVSIGGRVPFSFNYRDLHRVAPEQGGYVKVESRWRDGRLKYSFAVDRLHLPPYSGELSGETPVFAAGLIARMSRELPGFQLRGEGKARISKKMVGYDVLYTARVEGRLMYGRDVLILPSRAGARDGVYIAMLTAPGASPQVTSPLEVGTTGVLNRPLKTFAFG